MSFHIKNVCVRDNYISMNTNCMRNVLNIINNNTQMYQLTEKCRITNV